VLFLITRRRGGRRVDPYHSGPRWWSGVHPNEAFGIPLESLAENSLALGHDVVCPAMVEHFGREQADAAVMVLGVVPGEEDLAEGASVLD
jgi:hypothetical protein